MADVTVKIPAGYADDFLQAIIAEVEWEGDCVVTHAKEGADALDELRLAADLLAHDVALLDQVQASRHDGDDVVLRVEGRRRVEMLPHVMEAMATKIVGQRLQQKLEVAPIDMDYLPEIRELVDRLSWATDQAAEMHEKAVEARAEGRS